MHYYKRNIGDYHKKAGRLSMLQHGAYTLLIDSCYDREKFPTLEEAIDWSWASSAEEVEAVKFVLSKFFTLDDGRYSQKHIKEDLFKYTSNAETNKRIALDREARRREKQTNRARSVNEPTRKKHEAPPNQEPLTKNQEPLTKNQEPLTKNQEPAPKVAWIPPEGLNLEAWEDYEQHRKTTKGKFTDLARTKAANTIKNLSHADQQATIDRSIQSGWPGLYPDKAKQSISQDLSNQVYTDGEF